VDARWQRQIESRGTREKYALRYEASVRRAAWTCSMDLQHGPAAWTCSMEHACGATGFVRCPWTLEPTSRIAISFAFIEEWVVKH